MDSNQGRVGRILTGLAAAAALLFVGAAAHAGKVHSWETEEGTLAFTDDLKRVPARYQAQATTRELGGIGDYVRFTGADEKERVLYAARLQNRLTRLRETNGAVALALPSGEGEAAFLVRTSGSDNGVSTQVGFPLADAEEEPIVTNNVRMMPENSIATRHVTIVRQGDRILSVVKPALNQYPGTFPSEAELDR